MKSLVESLASWRNCWSKWMEGRTASAWSRIARSALHISSDGSTPAVVPTTNNSTAWFQSAPSYIGNQVKKMSVVTSKEVLLISYKIRHAAVKDCDWSDHIEHHNARSAQHISNVQSNSRIDLQEDRTRLCKCRNSHRNPSGPLILLQIHAHCS